MSKFLDRIKERAKQDKKTIVLAEGEDIRTVKAADMILKEGIADIILLGDKKKIAELEIERLKTDFNIEDNKLFEKLKEAAITASNAREIKHLVKDTFSLLAIRKICSDAEE